MAKPAKDKFDPKTFLAKVGEGKSISKLGKGQNVFVQGDVADAVFYIQKGKIKLTVVSDQGKEAVVGMLEPGQFFGEGCLNGQPLRIATTTAMEDSIITRISKLAMISALEGRPKFSQLFMHAPLPFFRRERSLPSVTGESRRMGGDEQLYAYVLGIASAKTSRNSSEIEFAGLSASECRAMLLAQATRSSSDASRWLEFEVRSSFHERPEWRLRFAPQPSNCSAPP